MYRHFDLVNQKLKSHVYPSMKGRFVIALCVSLMLSGCVENSILYSIEDYQSRLKRITQYREVDTKESAHKVLIRPRIPERRNRLIPQPEYRVSLYDVLGLNYCELPQLMAQKNAPLGKVMQAPVAFIYAFDIREALRFCQANLTQAQPKTLEKHRILLSQLQAQKQSQQIITLWNLTIGSFPMTQYAGTPGRLFDGDAYGELISGANAFEFFHMYGERLNAEHYLLSSEDRDTIYVIYQHLEQTQALGALINSLIAYTNAINHATHILLQTKAARFCPQGLPIERVKILKHVVVKYFGQGVQRHIAPIDQAAEAYFRQIDKFLALFEPLENPQQVSFFQYWNTVYRETDSIWLQYRKAITDHAKAASTLLAHCGAGVGQSG